MCGRFQIAATFDVLVALYKLGPPPAGMPGIDPKSHPDPPLLPRLNIAPTQVVPVIRGIAHARHAVPMRWGFPMTWLQATGKNPWSRTLINAKVEEAADKHTWSSSLRARRCLVPVTGFYEWARVGRKRYPLLFQRVDELPMALAGIWSRFQRNGQPCEVFAVLTSASAKELARFHHRAPVMIEPEQWDTWLDPSLQAQGVAALLRPMADGALRFSPVGTALNDVKHATPDLHPDWSLDQLAEPQLTLPSLT